MQARAHARKSAAKGDKKASASMNIELKLAIMGVIISGVYVMMCVTFVAW